MSALQAQVTKAEKWHSSPLGRKIQLQEKELSRVEAAIREAQKNLAETTSQYSAQLKRIANSEEPEVDVSDLKRKMNVLEDVIGQGRRRG